MPNEPARRRRQQKTEFSGLGPWNIYMCILSTLSAGENGVKL